ncbi:unnamed protein product, partial [Heterosigma akashiwo]
MLLLGAIVMSNLERSDEIESVEEYNALLVEMHSIVREIEAEFNHSSVVSHFEEFMDHISPYLTGKSSVPDVSNPNWDLEGSAFFCWTIMTTIGYGSYSPSTRAGKLFVTLYTIVSVPLFLVSLAHLSSSMAKLGQFVAGRFQTNGSESKTFVFGIFALGVFYLLGSAVIFAEGHTGWDYLDAVYYAVITLFTVGLGDYTPSLNEQSIVGFLVYTFLGLLLIGTISKSIQRVYD